MNQKGKFILLTRDEFKDWLSNASFRRIIKIIQNHHTWKPSYAQFDGKNHFFIFDFIGDAMKQIWGSSNLGEPNCEFQIADIDNDGKNDLIVIEGDYSHKPKCNGNYVAVWKWNDWGFSNEWRSEKGTFSNLEIEKNDGKSYIVVDSF